MTAKELTYVLPLEKITDVGKAINKLQSTMKELGYESGPESEKYIFNFHLARFIAGEPTLCFTAIPPLSKEDEKYIQSNIPSVIAIFQDGGEEQAD